MWQALSHTVEEAGAYVTQWQTPRHPLLRVAPTAERVEANRKVASRSGCINWPIDTNAHCKAVS